MTKQTPPGDGRGRRRSLSQEEAQLWQTITRTIRSIAPRPEASGSPAKPVKPGAPAVVQHRSPSQPAKELPAGSPAGAKARSSHHTAAAVPKKSNGAAPALANFDTRAARRLASGQHDIEARLDLHGMRQSEAHAALRRFLLDCHAQGMRYVKVITGKGSPSTETAGHGYGQYGIDGAERGVLRRAVPQWLAESEFRALVVSHTSAGRGHGGEGALYVQLRRPGRVGQRN